MHEVDAQHGLHCKVLAPASALGGIGLYQRDPLDPGHHQLHRIKELALAGAFDDIDQAQTAFVLSRLQLCSITAHRDSCRGSLELQLDNLQQSIDRRKKRTRSIVSLVNE